MEYKKQRREAHGKSTELPGDLITAIISRVPAAKDLIRFTCVSKSWSSFIYTDPHLSRTASTDRPYFVLRSPSEKKSLNYWFDLDSIDDENAQLEQIFNPFNRKAQVVGSCHGLLVLQQRSTLKIAVSNPTTKKHHMVPPNPAGDDDVLVCGFGYDQVHGCYKLVTRVCDDHAVELMIYDVNNRTWKNSKFDDLDHEYYSSIDFYAEGVYIDGALYWCVDLGSRDTESMKIIRFVLAEEEFEEVEPPNFGDIIMYDPNITVFDGRLCLSCEDHSEPGSDCYTIEFWLMEAECDERQSYPRRWTNFLSIWNPWSLVPLPPGNPSLIPICFSVCGNKVLFTTHWRQLFWYDVAKNEFSKLKNSLNTDPDFRMVGVTCCERSLVGVGIF